MVSHEIGSIPPEGRQPKYEDSRFATHSPEIVMETTSTKKPPSFYFSFLALNLMVFVISLDATALNVAIPVCSIEPIFERKHYSILIPPCVAENSE